MARDAKRIRVFNPTTNKVKYVTPKVANSTALRIQGFIRQDAPKQTPIAKPIPQPIPQPVVESDDELLSLEEEGGTTESAQADEPTPPKMNAKDTIKLVEQMTSKKQLKKMLEDESRVTVIRAINQKLETIK